MNEVVEAKGHGPLKGGSNIFYAKRHDTIHKSAPGGSESGFVLLFFTDMNLVITRKTIHERKYFVAGTGINGLVNEQSGEVFFGTCQIQVTEVNTYANGTIFFINGNKIGNLSVIRDGLYET